MKKIELGGRWIGESEPCFIIAEAGSNHDAKLEQAKELIDVAAEAGADVVKFQLFTAENLYPKNCGIVDTLAGEVDFFKLLKQIEVSTNWLQTLKEYAESKGIVFLCSVFSEEAVDELEKINPPAYKVGSPELSHLPLLKYVARLHKPIVLSTGLSKIGDIEEALDTCYAENNHQTILMHCVSGYPTPLEDCNLRVINTLKAAFDVPVGFSDHTLDPVIASSVAAALGANIIEKHFTLSKELKGPDHPFALEPPELRQMVREIREIEELPIERRLQKVKGQLGEDVVERVLGTSKKTIAPSEEELYPCDRRSIHAIKDLRKDDILTKDNTRILRSERNLRPGLHPRYYDLVLGKTLVRDISYGQGIVWEDLLK